VRPLRTSQLSPESELARGDRPCYGACATQRDAYKPLWCYTIATPMSLVYNISFQFN